MNQLDEYRQQLTDKAFELAVFDGWTEKTLRHAAKEAGIEVDMLGILFPGGVVDVIAHHSQQADAAMAEYLQSLELENMPVPAKVKAAVMWRFQQFAPQREAIRLALTLLSFPLHAARGTKLLYQTVDTIWYEIGDQSTDYNFYTKRLLLAGVYSSTLHIWLDDGSDNFSETEAFLDRRLADVGKIGRCKKTLQNKLAGFASPFKKWRMA
jgi:ubiquinone biosynthesis protein COQ9